MEMALSDILHLLPQFSGVKVLMLYGLGEPLIDSQMKQQSSFVDWDMVNIWDIGENQKHELGHH